MTKPKCRCGHLEELHGIDRKQRPVCWGLVCGCAQWEPNRHTLPALSDHHPDKQKEQAE